MALDSNSPNIHVSQLPLQNWKELQKKGKWWRYGKILVWTVRRSMTRTESLKLQVLKPKPRRSTREDEHLPANMMFPMMHPKVGQTYSKMMVDADRTMSESEKGENWWRIWFQSGCRIPFVWTRVTDVSTIVELGGIRAWSMTVLLFVHSFYRNPRLKIGNILCFHHFIPKSRLTWTPMHQETSIQQQNSEWQRSQWK